MASLNKIALIGNLGRDPELKQTQGGSTFCVFSMATKEEWTDASGTKQEKTEWHDVAVFTKAAPACAKYLSKGSLVYVEGKLQSREWEKDGVKRRAWTVNAMNVVFLSFKEKPQQASAYDDPFVGEPAGAPADDADIPF